MTRTEKRDECTRQGQGRGRRGRRKGEGRGQPHGGRQRERGRGRPRRSSASGERRRWITDQYGVVGAGSRRCRRLRVDAGRRPAIARVVLAGYFFGGRGKNIATRRW